MKRFGVTKSSGFFEIGLSYRNAFEVDIKAYNGYEGEKGFCEVYPAMITAKMDYTSPIPSEDIHSYDNIVFYQGYYFILDSISYSILFTYDITDPDTFELFESDYENEIDENGDFEEPFMMVGSDGVLYIISTKVLFSLDLNAFIGYIEDEDEMEPAPEMKKKIPEHKGSTIWNAEHSNNLLFIATDNVVNIYKTTPEGVQDLVAKFDAIFFEIQKTAIIDIVVKGKYAFVLDTNTGLYVVDISNYATTGKFTLIPNLTQSFSKARFVEIIGNSINIVFASIKSQYLDEYIIKGDFNTGITDILFNRKTNMIQAVRDTYSDGNFLYIITGFMNMVFRPGITSKYDTNNVTDYLSNYWAFFGAKSMVSLTQGSKSMVVAIKDDFVSIIMFEESNPFLSCDITQTPPGIYTYQLHALQQTCPAKQKNILDSADDFHVVCEVEETIVLLVTEDAASIGNVSKSKMNLLLLTVGVGIMTVLVLVFIYFTRKYRNKYRILEDQIKFQKLESNAESRNNDDMKTDAEVEASAKENEA